VPGNQKRIESREFELKIEKNNKALIKQLIQSLILFRNIKEVFENKCLKNKKITDAQVTFINYYLLKKI